MSTKYYIYSISHATDSSLGRYIGSTRHLKKRLAVHKCHCKNKNNNNKLYQIIRDTGGWHNWVFKTLEVITSDNPEDRRKAEQKWIEAQEIKINTYDAYCPCKVYYNKNRDDILEHKKVYYEQNKQAIIDRRKHYRKMKRLQHVAELEKLGMKPKRASKYDPLPHQEKMRDNNIQNDCECVQIQSEE